LRQLHDARTFFHNGSFTSVRDVVSYFNNGVPQDPTAGAAATLDTRFTHPVGSSQNGLGLSATQIDEITDFLTNALYSPTFAANFQPVAADLTFSSGSHNDLLVAATAAGQTLPDGLLLSLDFACA
jgi:hypothetical protein